MIEVGPLRPEDRAAWEVLARGYKAFYQDPMLDEAYEATWRRLAAGTELYGLGARLDGRLAGIAHYFFHPAFWSGEACYLQDLFTDEAVRGRGVARAHEQSCRKYASQHEPGDSDSTSTHLASRLTEYSSTVLQVNLPCLYHGTG